MSCGVKVKKLGGYPTVVSSMKKNVKKAVR